MTARFIDDAERRSRMARRHLLLPGDRPADPAAVADAVVLLHSSDPVSVHLSALARLRTPAIAVVQDALYRRRTLLRHHGLRRTLWVGSPEVIAKMHAAATVRLQAPEERRIIAMLTAGGVAEPATWLADAARDVLDVFGSNGSRQFSTRELGELLPRLALRLPVDPRRADSPSAGAHTRLLLLMGFRGDLVRAAPVGRWISGQYRWAATEAWSPDALSGGDPREATRQLVDRWLHRFGPGSTTDLAWWTGLPVTWIRTALAELGAVQVATDAGAGWVAADDVLPVEPAPPWVAVLPSLDPTVMGWKERAWYLPPAAADSFDRNGNAGPTIMVDGQVVGAWAQLPDGRLSSHYFVELSASRRRQVQRRLAEVAEWIGETRYTVRFPGLIDATLQRT